MQELTNPMQVVKKIVSIQVERIKNLMFGSPEPETWAVEAPIGAELEPQVDQELLIRPRVIDREELPHGLHL
jgi:hypothetical protein